MRLLFIGDIVGKPGRDMVAQCVAGLRARHRLDLIVVNAENSAAGSGITPSIYRQLIGAGVDGVTLGDHVYRRREISPLLESQPDIVKPANLPASAAGHDVMRLTARDGTPVAVVSILGRLFMQPVDCPYRAADRVLATLPAEVKVILVDFHVEATSEAQLMGRYLDGRVSAVLGTHTHVPTADECILPGGTAFQCDVGMTGPYESILGRRIDRVMETTLTWNPTQFEVATGDVRISGTIVEVDSATGKASHIGRLVVRESEVPALQAAAKQAKGDLG